MHKVLENKWKTEHITITIALLKVTKSQKSIFVFAPSIKTIYTAIAINGCSLGLDDTSITTIGCMVYTSYKKFVFRDFVQNSWGFDMGMVIFDLRGHGGC